jgi:hypothetical protein
MQIVNASQAFGAVSGTGPQSTTQTVTLPGPVSTATAILTGFIVEFSHGDDHHLGQLDVQVQVPPQGVNGQSVQVQVIYGLRNWDDAYDGTVFFAVVGE